MSDTGFPQPDEAFFQVVLYGPDKVAVWTGGNVIWFFNREVPLPFDPENAEDAVVLGKGFSDTVTPQILFDQMTNGIAEKSEVK